MDKVFAEAVALLLPSSLWVIPINLTALTYTLYCVDGVRLLRM